jgi:hypothetical protein
MKLYMFRTVPLFVIRSFSLYKQKWYMSYRFVESNANRIRMELRSILTLLALLSTNLYDIHHCCVYGEKLLMMDTETVRNM